MSVDRTFTSSFAQDTSGGDSSCNAATDVSGYAFDRTANLESVLQTNVPEPYEASQSEDLKEGVPEGLSDTVRSRGARDIFGSPCLEILN